MFCSIHSGTAPAEVVVVVVAGGVPKRPKVEKLVVVQVMVLVVVFTVQPESAVQTPEEYR